MPDIDSFIAAVNAKLREYFEQQYPGLVQAGLVDQVRAESGPKYYKVVKFNKTSSSAYCFIDRKTGDIYKAASWKAPAKGVRGNISDPDFGWNKAINAYGAVSLR